MADRRHVSELKGSSQLVAHIRDCFTLFRHDRFECFSKVNLTFKLFNL